MTSTLRTSTLSLCHQMVSNCRLDAAIYLGRSHRWQLFAASYRLSSLVWNASISSENVLTCGRAGKTSWTLCNGRSFSTHSSLCRGLYVSKKLGPLISPALQAFTDERATEVLPSLLYLFFEGFRPSGRVHEATKPFVTARQQSGFPVAVLRWVRELDGYSEFGDWEVDD